MLGPVRTFGRIHCRNHTGASQIKTDRLVKLFRGRSQDAQWGFQDLYLMVCFLTMYARKAPGANDLDLN